MPSEMNIRIDLSFIIPMIIFLCLNGIAKLGIMMTMKARTLGDRELISIFPQRKIQMAFTLPILIVCIIMFRMMW